MKKIIAYVSLIISILCGCSPEAYDSGNTAAVPAESAGLTVSYIDVGQADSILITSPDGKNMLIDAGEGEGRSGAVLDYLKKRNITELDTVIATHPHSDHINAMDDVLDNIAVDKFYLPNASHTTRDFENMLDAAENANEVIQAKAGMSFNLGESVGCDILAPVSDSYDDLNNYSVVVKMVYGSTSFLFTGDAEKEVEKEILQSTADVSADVLKCGHHGSSTSTSADFLAAVDPDYAVISCGRDNDYGHPHKETLQKLEKNGTEVLRTDEMGTITLVSNGSEIVSVPPADTAEKPVQENTVGNTDEKIYVGNKNSKVYHTKDCSALPKEENRVYLTPEEAETNGYTPHKACIK